VKKVRNPAVLILIAASTLVSHAAPAEATWSGANGAIAFLSGPREGSPRTDDVWVMAADGSRRRNLTDTASPMDEDRPSWSPSGRKVVFVSNRDGDWDVYVMRRDGSRTRKLTHNKRDDRDPSWSPNGKKIVYTSDRRGVRDVFIMRADGSNARAIVQLASDAQAPVWSPSAQVIVFSMATGEGEGRDLYTIRPDGEGLKVLAQTSDEEYTASWSADGKWLVYSAVVPAPCGMCDPLNVLELFVMTAKGTDIQRLTDDAADDQYPVWSPDGTMIAFSSNREDPTASDVFVMNSDGTGLVNLTASPDVYDYFPDWQARP
jgi:Tol biopolymer transport system component